jgi:hypothetical protein
MGGGQRRRRRIVAAAAGIVLLGSLACVFVWGRLFPYSPVIVGFDRINYPCVAVYTQKGFDFGDTGWIDSLPRRVEEFHELDFRSRPRVFLFGDEGTYSRRSPSRARLCAFPSGSIVVSPWASRENAEGLISLETYLTHEMSHTLLYQHMDLIAAMRYPRWLLEGIATLGAGQMGSTFYPDPDETRRLIAAGNWMPPETFGTDAEDGVGLDVEYRQPFIYCEFALIVEDLIDRFGRVRFQEYMTRLFEEGDHDEVFQREFGVDFVDYIAEFRSGVP